ncbi:MAG TPA: hypothetical protein ENI97_12445 [Gammaproteobacteria bacterium]|nr:hypothetical protein [Gammaproteobacteria bacterium]
MKALFFGALLFNVLLFSAQVSQAEMFRWVDDSGKVHIGIKPPSEPVKTEKDDSNANKNTDEKTNETPMAVKNPAPPKPAMEHKTTIAKPVETPNAIPANATPAKTPATQVTQPTPAPVVAAPKVSTPPKAAVSKKSPKPKVVQQAPAKQPIAAKKKAQIKKTIRKKAIAKKKPKKSVKAKKVAKSKKSPPAKTKVKKSADQRNEEMCGVFTAYVSDYKEKVSNCSPSVCDIYKRSLARYQKKQKAYCG